MLRTLPAVVGPEWVAWLADLARVRFHAAAYPRDLAVALPLLHETLSKLLELATVLRLAGLFLDLPGELLPLRALGEALGPLEQ
jgi:hypothetical protein